MLVYVLDEDFKREEVVDDYRSFIWTERFNRVGDFELKLNPSVKYRSLFQEGKLLMIDNSKRVMIVDEVDDGVNEEGEPTLTITGPSYEGILDSKVPRLEGQLSIKMGSKRGDFNDAIPSNFDEMFDSYGSADYEINSNDYSDITDSSIMHLAIHGGAGRPGTSELMYDTALGRSTYEMRIRKTALGSTLRLSSSKYDEPEAIQMVEAHQAALSWHGSGSENQQITYIGGTNVPLKRELRDHLTSKGFVAVISDPNVRPEFEGIQRQAIMNRASRGGAMLILSNELLDAMFTDRSTLAARQNPANRTQVYHNYVDAVRDAVEAYIEDHVLTLSPRELELVGYPQDVMSALVEDSIVKTEYNNGLSNPDYIDAVQMQDIYDPGDIPWPEASIDMVVKSTTLRRMVEDLAASYHLGYRMVRCPHCHNMKFSVYSGSDRFETIRFSQDLQNFNEARSFRSLRDYRNVAYVTSNFGSIIVYAPGVSEEISKMDRRSIFVDAGDYKYDESDTYMDDMYAKGYAALLEHNQISAVDGEVPTDSGYIYDVDYHLGDVVGVEGPDGTIGKMRVTEYIFISDAEGVRSYPTLSQEKRVSLGTWLSAEWDIDWLDAEGVWEEV